MKTYYVYIMASGRKGTIYVGVTSDLEKRVAQHKSGVFDGFTKEYRVHDLVYVESTNDVRGALEREKRLKGWRRCWKIELIEKNNPEWNDLAVDPGSRAGMTTRMSPRA